MPDTAREIRTATLDAPTGLRRREALRAVCRDAARARELRGRLLRAGGRGVGRRRADGKRPGPSRTTSARPCAAHIAARPSPSARVRRARRAFATGLRARTAALDAARSGDAKRAWTQPRRAWAALKRALTAPKRAWARYSDVGRRGRWALFGEGARRGRLNHLVLPQGTARPSTLGRRIGAPGARLECAEARAPARWLKVAARPRRSGAATRQTSRAGGRSAASVGAVPDLNETWAIACADAGLDQRFVVLAGADTEALHDAYAVHVAPSERLGDDSPLPVTLARAINAPAHVGQHRIGVVTRVPEAALLGILRHELEHVRQYESSDELKLTYRMQPVLAEALGRALPGPASGVNYQLIPHEHDAHVASSALVRRQGLPVPAELLAGTHRPLFDTEPLPVDALPLGVRAMAFAALFPDEVREVLGEWGVGVASVCGHVGVDFARWNDVALSADVMAAARRARELTPTPGALAEAPAAERRALRQPARDEIVRGFITAAAALAG